MGMWIQRNHDTESSEAEQADFSVNQEIRSLIDHESSGEGLTFNETREDLDQPLVAHFPGIRV